MKKAMMGLMLAWAGASMAQTAPQAADIVKGQAVFAMAHLRAMSAIMGADPDGAFSKEALRSGRAPVQRGWASPEGGWPARGPTLNESLDSSFAMIEAGLRGCPAVSGPCQDQALSAGKARAQAVRQAKNPGAEMARQVAALDALEQARAKASPKR